MPSVHVPVSSYPPHGHVPEEWRRAERRALWITALLFFLLLLPAVRDARRDARDDQRLNDLSQIKRTLEQYYNMHSVFPRTSRAEPLTCVFSDTNDWGSLGMSEDSFLFDPPLPRERQWRRFPYAYCPTTVGQKRDEGSMSGFFLQAALEHPRLSGSGFDTQEGRNFRYRVIYDRTWTFYRICGGDDPSCDGPS